jgi:hypothetical protein
MRVDLTNQALCAAVDGCGLAMACRAGRCGPCAVDGDCASGEACVLEHCVPATAVGCRGRRDCGAGELCVLSGYSDDPRGNRDLRATCIGDTGGHAPAEGVDLAIAGSPAGPAPYEARALLDDVEADAKR